VGAGIHVGSLFQASGYRFAVVVRQQRRFVDINYGTTTQQERHRCDRNRMMHLHG
jgi:hypothetical protein